MDKPPSKGIVKTWHPEDGWGSIKVDGLAEECFAHSSCIAQSGNEFHGLVPGDHVMVTWHYAQQDNFSAIADLIEPYSPVRVFDTSFDYKTDTPAKTRPDPDKDSQRLRLDHELLWTKELRPGVSFARAFHRLAGTSTSSSLTSPRRGIATAATRSPAPTPLG